TAQPTAWVERLASRVVNRSNLLAAKFTVIPIQRTPRPRPQGGYASACIGIDRAGRRRGGRGASLTGIHGREGGSIVDCLDRRMGGLKAIVPAATAQTRRSPTTMAVSASSFGSMCG